MNKDNNTSSRPERWRPEEPSWEPLSDDLFNPATEKTGATATASEWFEADPKACFIVDCSGRVCAANTRGRLMLEAGSGISSNHGQLTFHCEASQRILRFALNAVCDRGAGRVRRIVRADDAQWRVVWVVPSRQRSLAFVTVSQSDDNADADDLLTDAFGFTRTEARVMTYVLRGDSPKEIGGSLGMSINTVRTHLRGVYAKMNVRGLVGAIRLATRLTTN